MKTIILSINSAKTFEKKLYGVSKYTLSNYLLFSSIGEAELIVYAPPVFYAKGRYEENYFRILKAGKEEKLEEGITLKYLSLGDFLRFSLGYLRWKEFYSPFYYLDLEFPEGDLLVYEFFSLVSCAKSTRAKRIYRPHEVYAVYRKGNPEVLRQEREALEEADLVLAPSEMDVKSFSSIYGISKDKFEVLPVPVNMKEKKLPKRSYEDEEKVSLLFSGFPHLENMKAVNRILEISKEFPQVTFHIYGPFRDFKSRKNVIFHGFVPKEEYKRALLEADAAFMPLEQRTGINLRVIEYVSYGLPIIGTLQISRGYEMKPWEHFIPIDLSSKESLEEAFSKVSSGAFRRELATRAFQYFSEELSLENLSRKLKGILRRI